MQHGGQIHRSIGLLAIFQNRDQAAANSEAGAVERMHEFGFAPGCRAETGIHAAGLKIATDGNRADLAVGVLAGQPDLQIMGFCGAKAHIAGAKHHSAIGKPQFFKDIFGAAGHAVMFRHRGFGGGDRHHLHLLELVLAQHPGGILARGPASERKHWVWAVIRTGS